MRPFAARRRVIGSRSSQALLFPRNHLGPGRSDHLATSENKLVRLLDTAHIGGLVSEVIFANGYRSVNSVAVTSTQSWEALVASTVSCPNTPGRPMK